MSDSTGPVISHDKGWRWWLNVSLAVGGYILAFVLFLASRETRRMVFLVHPSRTEIVRSANLRDAPLRLLRPDGTVVASDVYAVHFVLWNAGNKPILAGDVLEPLRIVLEDTSATILDFRVMAVSRSLTKVDASVRPPRRIAVGFRVLEPEDGFRGQIIYAGPAATPIRFDGEIIGVHAIEYGPPTSFAHAARIGWYAGAFVIAFGILLVVSQALSQRSVKAAVRQLRQRGFFSAFLKALVAFVLIFWAMAFLGQGRGADIYGPSVPASLRP